MRTDDVADLARGLVAPAVEALSRGYTELTSTFAASDELRRLVEEVGPAEALRSDDPVMVGLRKQNREFATQAERRAEGVMRTLVRQAFPGHAVIGEELGALDGDEWLWVFDPIDGTSAMVRAALADAFSVTLPAPAPAFGITIAAVHGDAARVGVVGELRPADGGLTLTRTWVGVTGRPTMCDAEPVRPPTDVALATATLACTVPEVMFSTPATWAGFQALRDRTAAFVPDQNCVGFMRLLGGGVDVVAERDLTLPDAAALLPILLGAGVVVTDHDGREVRFDAGARDREYALLAAAPVVHAQALEVMRVAVPDPALSLAVPEPHQGYAKKFVSEG